MLQEQNNANFLLHALIPLPKYFNLIPTMLQDFHLLHAIIAVIKFFP